MINKYGFIIYMFLISTISTQVANRFTSEPSTFAEACALPGAMFLTHKGHAGLVNAVEVNGMTFYDPQRATYEAANFEIKVAAKVRLYESQW